MSPLQTLGYLENNTLGHCTEENLPPTNYTVRYLVHNTIHRVSTVHYYLVYVVQCSICTTHVILVCVFMCQLLISLYTKVTPRHFSLNIYLHITVTTSTRRPSTKSTKLTVSKTI